MTRPGLPVLLVQPPHAKACEPPPGLLALAGYLRARGIAVEVADLNLEVQERLLSASSLEAGAARQAAGGAAGPPLSSARRAVRRAPEGLAALRRAETYREWGPYRAGLDAVAEGWRALSRARGARWSVSDLEVPGLSPLSSADLLAVSREPERLPLFPELAAAARPLLDADPALIGVSATYLSQLLPAFALAGELRRLGYRGRLVLGGGSVTSWGPRLTPASPVFQAWDGLVAGPGEAALELLARGGRPAHAPGLLAPGFGAWSPAGSAGISPVCFAPDPAGWPWGRYLAPGPLLPLAASRGCYWRRCAFCPEAAQDRQPFRAGTPEALAEAILRARDAVGATRLHLTDDAVPPALLRRLARRLRGEGVAWYGFARLERQLLEPGFARELAEGGCALLQLGVETASQRLLDRMGKGTRAADAGSVLRNLAEAGIRTFVYLLFGLPGETREEAESTVEWAADHAPWITFANLALFHLPRGSSLEAGLPDDARGFAETDLSLYHPSGGPEPSGARAGRRRLRELVAGARRHPDLRPILARTPSGFTSNHAAFAPLPGPGAAP
ncbi:MAG: radical SAM protein [Thermodesulfobacteriota bacterium]